MKQDIYYPPGGGGGRYSLKGPIRESSRPFSSGFRYNERVGILLTEVFKRVGKSVIWVCEMAQRAEQMNFMTL